MNGKLESIQPRYSGGSIVNLMSSLSAALGRHTAEPAYPVSELLQPEQIRDARNVVLLVMDGLGDDYVQRTGGTLMRYRCGCLTSVFPTTTAAAITTFVTALAPQQHGITGWFMYLRELGSVAAIMPFRPRWGSSSYTDSGIDARSMLSFKSCFDTMDVDSFFVIENSIKDSAYSEIAAGRARRLGYRGLDGCIETIVNTVRNRGRQRKLIYVYWPQFDAVAHKFGVASEELALHYAELDRAFEMLLSALSGTDTLLIATADHGLIDASGDAVVHLEHHPELAGLLRLPLCGEPRTVYCYVRPGMQQQFEKYVTTRLAQECELYRSEDLVDAGWFGQGRPHPELMERIGDYTLMMKHYHIMKDRIIGEPPWTYIGVHGGVSAAEMYVPLIQTHL